MDVIGEDIPAPQPTVSSLAPVWPRAARSPGWVCLGAAAGQGWGE